MMNRIVYSALAIFCFAIASCTKEAPTSDYSKDNIVLKVFNSPMTMAEDDATAYERQLNRLDCFFYVKDKTDEPCVYYHRVDINNTKSATVSFFVNDLVLKEIYPSGSLCDVFVIANIPGNPTFEAKTDGTTMETLGKYVLDMTAGEYDVVDKPFVMTGSARVQKGQNSNATADIKLARVASKVTMKVKVPKSIEVGSEENKVTMLPILKDNEGNEPLKTSFHYGTSKSYLSGAYHDDPANYINTGKIPYTLSEETDTHYVFTCDMPFYTYARSWEKGSDNAAYVTFEMPWGVDENKDQKADEYKTYYYQILVNGKERNFVPNTHYGMTVTVGVLGSTVESLPAELDVWSYYILNWTEETTNGGYGSGDRDEDVEIQKFNYLEVPQTYIEMDDVPEVAIRYNASHKIGVKWDTDTSNEKTENGNRWIDALGGTTTLSALYINNGSGTPQAVEITDINLKENFTDNNKGSLTFKYTLSDAVYSPAYVFITIWLDIDGDGVHDDDEVLTENVKIVIYPAIYIIGDESNLYSVFVNGNYNKDCKNSDTDLRNMSYLTINGQRVGKATGYDSSRYMHVICVSAFSEDNCMFAYNNENKLDSQYIIGDPRTRTSNTYGVTWANDPSGETLEFYYPTSTDPNAYQVIAPKFRISSKLAGYSHSSPLGAAYRCASYQEDGFPAGRWRLPTTAEVLFVINLQKDKKIQELFYGTSTYASATDNIKNNNNTFTLTKGHNGFNNNTNLSVRCVYDEWYWGSEREAIANSAYNNYGGYQFTWGDEKIY